MSRAWSLGAIFLVRVFSAWAGLGKVGQTGFPSLCKGEQGFQPNNSNYFHFSNSFICFLTVGSLSQLGQYHFTLQYFTTILYLRYLLL